MQGTKITRNYKKCETSTIKARL